MDNRRRGMNVLNGRMGIAAAVLAVTMVAVPGSSAAFAQMADGEKAAEVAAQARRPAMTEVSPQASPLERWVDLQAASLLARFRYIENGQGAVMRRELQDSANVKARFKFDARGYYALNTVLATGASFTSGWNNTGAGSDRANDLSIKQFFFVATPVNGFHLSAGGMGIVRGESSEITSYDNDGYVVGERVSVKRPELFFNEITVTNAYLGDLATPNVFTRFHRLGEANYRQFLVAKTATPWLTVSADYTRVAGVGTVRAAGTAKTRRTRVIDLVGYEQYHRGDPNPAFGFGAFVEKVAWRAVIRGGYADIDPDYGGLNADRFNTGRRWYVQSDFKITRDLTVWLFVTRAVQPSLAMPNATRVDFVATYNAMAPLQRAGFFR